MNPLDVPVPVKNMESGEVLVGESAPKRRDLEKWLADHPNYQVHAASFKLVQRLLSSFVFLNLVLVCINFLI